MKQTSRGFRIIPIFILVFLCGCAGGLRMTVLHMNDSHSHVESLMMSPSVDGVKTMIPVGGLARATTKIQTVRESGDHVLFLHAGDAIQGTLYFTNYHGEPEFDWLNQMQCDAMVTGNHEYDKGAETLARLVDRVDFPVLAGNVDASSNAHLQGKLLPYTIHKVGRDEIGIIGLVSPDTPDTSNPEDTIIFHDTKAAAIELIEILISKGINKIIVLSHIGYERDIELARTVDHIDLIVGGHTHTLLGDADDPLIPGVEGPYPTVVTGPSGNPVCVVQAWGHTRAVGELNVTFNRKGIIAAYDGQIIIPVGDTFYQKDAAGQPVAVDSSRRQRILDVIDASTMIEIVPEDPGILEWIRPYSEGIDDLKGVVIGYSAEEILNVRVPGTRHETTGEFMAHGSDLAPLVADSMYWKANQVGLNVDFAIQNAGGVRMDLPAGEMTIGMVYELMPFENTLYVLEITGRQIVELLESLMERILVPDNDGAFPYTSRLTFSADMNLPKGSRVSIIRIPDDHGEWQALDPDAIYRVATNQYLASGRDGYAVFRECTGYRYDTGFQDAEIFMEYVQAIESLSKDPEPRITFLPVSGS